MPRGLPASTSKISIRKVGMITLAILAFLIFVYVLTPTASCSESYESWIKVNDKDWFEQCSHNPGGKKHKTQWGEIVYYGWEKNKSCVWKGDGGGHKESSKGRGYSGGYPVCSSNSDPDGDGWGWENNESCKMPWLADKDEGRRNRHDVSDDYHPEKAKKIRQEEIERGGRPMTSSQNKIPWWKR